VLYYALQMNIIVYYRLVYCIICADICVQNTQTHHILDSYKNVYNILLLFTVPALLDSVRVDDALYYTVFVTHNTEDDFDRKRFARCLFLII